jgi:predicted nucleic acid-binding protein
MVKTQIQLPEHLYREAKRIAAEYEMSFAEVVRRSLERTVPAYPHRGAAPWQPPELRDLGQRCALDEGELRLLAPVRELIDYPGGLMDDVWAAAVAPRFARRRIYDARLAHTLLHHGVTEFATANLRGFEGFGLARVWNPLVET